MNIVVSTVNFIRSRSLNHRQFRELLIDIEADYGDVIYHSEVRWLSRGKVLKRIYDLRKKSSYLWIWKENHCWNFLMRAGFQTAFLVDKTQHLNDLNLQLQRRNQLVNDIFAHVKAFEVKLRSWEIHLTKPNTANFSNFKCQS
jgi:hypothetical protein